MLYKRQKILLALLEEFGGELTNTDLQKYLFLLSTVCEEKVYHFVPYKYGCFSFQAYQDKRKLTEKGYLEEGEKWKLATQGRFREKLPFDISRIIWQIKKDYGHLRGESLIRYVYQKYPYYAIKSEIASKILTDEEMLDVESHKPCKTETTLCSIGYEGKDLEQYLNILIKEDVKILCDVRKNPISRKYGFSKRTLMNALNSLGIEYKHCPELGIESAKRQKLETQADYDTLFDEYEATVLKENKQGLKKLSDLLDCHSRVAITCYEKLPSQCHRTRIAKAILNEEKGLKFIEV